MEQEKRNKADTLAYLRSQIQEMEGFKPDTAKSPIKLNIKEIDDCLPGQALPIGAVHEVIGSGDGLAAAATGFMAVLLGLIAKAGGITVWISKRRSVFPPGLAQFGIDTDKVVFIDLARDQEILWASEEALRSKGIASVVSEISDVDLTATRRLQLAVEKSQVTGFLLRAKPRKTSASSCVTSWRVKPAPSEFSDGMPGVGFPRWEVELIRARNGHPGKWQIEWRDDALYKIQPALPSVVLHTTVAAIR